MPSPSYSYQSPIHSSIHCRTSTLNGFLMLGLYYLWLCVSLHWQVANLIGWNSFNNKASDTRWWAIEVEIRTPVKKNLDWPRFALPPARTVESKRSSIYRNTKGGFGEEKGGGTSAFSVTTFGTVMKNVLDLIS
ncbi:uncharacterized protein BO95DRAFT_170343 [Aspergillus brunneoviolaceus CBS 621.78]|uniref:Uncharacterized protein n=1 Tax=Aspergillus brunneoviolaceus CBS 621.78 TaxID=1450534 RepID=A0ACD1G6I4_9EURO|nr:hypothetical protein BO95DRAFT_170343 [Aspergillus brunneoviolaceus CBS 621.78]RAH44764.1 hypothetical protein BO95DRAFT_170343 [Aspergillus brunneoviolaceus CBS 621.78]